MSNMAMGFMKTQGRRSRIYAEAKKIRNRELGTQIYRQPEIEIENIRKMIVQRYKSGTGPFAKRIADTDDFSMTATSDLVLIRVYDQHYLLTREDLDSLKFAAMSHSMWHFYAGTIKTEYRKTTIADPDANDPAAQAGKNILAELEKLAKKIVPPAEFTQRVVPYDVVKGTLQQLWRLYVHILDVGISNGKQDYVGRYLSDLFSIYTARQGGRLMASVVPSLISALETEFRPHGFLVRYNLDTMIELFHALPESCIHDFGRLAKIVPAYDINPIYSYIDRAAKMANQTLVVRLSWWVILT
jgi:hypothetical protein